MCGITGFIDYTSNSDLTILHEMRDTLTHRGPDNKGALLINNEKYQIGLAHRRLSIIDLSNGGNQPMEDETGNCIIVFNGEIYNFNEIKRELLNLKVQFRTNSDTEVILKSYIQWGMEAIDKFIGMFAFAIYDKRKERLFFCRDRAGVKPFYYFVSTNIIIFGSEIKSLIAHPTFQKKINFSSVGTFFRHGWIAAPYTIFESTFKLKPGHYLEINLKSRKIDEHCYWDVHDFYNKQRLEISYEQAKEQLHELLKSACEYRMVSDTEVGIFLSGGFDSTTVAALLQTNRTKKINTFSIGFDEKEYNEAPYAKAVADRLGTNHHQLICTAKDALELVPKLPVYYDEPFADSSAIPTMLVSKFARNNVKVALSADGGDEIFCGYPRYYNQLNEFYKIKLLPGLLKKPLVKAMDIPIKALKNKNPLHKIRLEKLQKTLSFKSKAELFRYRSEPIHYSDYEIDKLLKEKAINITPITFYDEVQLSDAIDDEMIMMALEYKTTLADDLLVKVDRATMANSLEGREPFLDHRLVEFSARLNSDFHFKNRISKSLIREICYEYVPKGIMDRPKKGFAIPTNQWLNNELKTLVRQLSDSSFIKKQGIFDPKMVSFTIDNFYNGFDENAERIWIFIMFQMWYVKWMD